MKGKKIDKQINKQDLIHKECIGIEIASVVAAIVTAIVNWTTKGFSLDTVLLALAVFLGVALVGAIVCGVINVFC